MDWDEIELVFGSCAATAAALNAVLTEAGDPLVGTDTLYVWRSRGLPRGRRWALAEALRRAGRQVAVHELSPLSPESRRRASSQHEAA